MKREDEDNLIYFPSDYVPPAPQQDDTDLRFQIAFLTEEVMAMSKIIHKLIRVLKERL